MDYESFKDLFLNLNREVCYESNRMIVYLILIEEKKKYTLVGNLSTYLDIDLMKNGRWV